MLGLELGAEFLELFVKDFLEYARSLFHIISKYFTPALLLGRGFHLLLQHFDAHSALRTPSRYVRFPLPQIPHCFALIIDSQHRFCRRDKSELREIHRGQLDVPIQLLFEKLAYLGSRSWASHSSWRF